MKLRGLGLLTTVFVFSLVTPSYLGVEPVSAKHYSGIPTPFRNLNAHDRLTIISPHPDDETIALGGLIYRARQEHIPVSVIFLTNGDNDGPTGTPQQQIQIGKNRQREALNALAVLGVSSKSVFFLGLPDGGLESLLSKEHYRTPYVSPATGLSSNSAYDNSYIKNIPYTGFAARRSLIRAINATHPTRTFVTMREDLHRDHWAAGQLMVDINKKIGKRVAQYSFLIHYPNFPLRPSTPQTELVPPNDLRDRPWETIVLSADEEGHQAQALKKYVSQFQEDGSDGDMRRFTRPNELVIE